MRDPACNHFVGTAHLATDCPGPLRRAPLLERLHAVRQEARLQIQAVHDRGVLADDPADADLTPHNMKQRPIRTRAGA